VRQRYSKRVLVHNLSLRYRIYASPQPSRSSEALPNASSCRCFSRLMRYVTYCTECIDNQVLDVTCVLCHVVLYPVCQRLDLTASTASASPGYSRTDSILSDASSGWRTRKFTVASKAVENDQATVVSY
jgi:hypothetical protein